MRRIERSRIPTIVWCPKTTSMEDRLNATITFSYADLRRDFIGRDVIDRGARMGVTQDRWHWRRTLRYQLWRYAALVGLHARTGSWIDGIEIVCRRINQDGSLGETFTLGSAGGEGGNPVSQTCRGGW